MEDISISLGMKLSSSVNASIGKMNSAFMKFGSVSSKTLKGISSNYVKVQAEINKTNRSLEALLKKQEEVQSKLDGLDSKPKSASRMSLEESIRRNKMSVKEARKEYDDFRAENRNMAWGKWETEQQKLLEMQEQFKQAQEELNSPAAGDDWAARLENIADLYKQIQVQQEIVNRAEAGKKTWFRDSDYIAQRSALQEKIKRAKADLAINKTKLAELDAKDAQQRALLELESARISASIDNARQKIWELEVLMNHLEEDGVNAGSGISQSFKKAAGVIGSAMLKSVKETSSILGKLFGGATKALGKINLGKLIKDFVKWGLGVRSIFFLWRKFRSAIGEGLKNLGEFHAEFKSDLDIWTESLAMMKNAAAAAIQPLASYLIPIVQKLAEWFTKAAESVAIFFATLTGQGYIYRASSAISDYAGALEDEAGSASKAADQTKKALAAFDDLDVLSKESDTTGGGSGSGAGGGVGSFTKENIGDGESPLALLLKEAWKTSDFTAVGEYFRLALMSALENEELWTSLERMAHNIVNSVVTFINSFIQPDLGASVGKAFARLIDLGVASLNDLIGEGGIDWYTVGYTIGIAIGNAIKNLKADDLAELINNLVDALTMAIKGAIDGLSRNKEEITQKLKDFFGGLEIDTISLALGVLTITTIKNIVFSKTVSKAVSIALANALSKGEAGSGIISAAGGLGNWLSTAMGVIASGIQTHGLVGFVMNLFSGIGTAISSSVSSIGAVLATPLGLVGASIAAIFAGSIIENWDSDKSFLENIGTGFGEVFSSIMTALEPFIRIIKDGLVPVLNVVWELLKGLWNEVLVPLGEFLLNTFGNALVFISNIFTQVILPAVQLFGEVLYTLLFETLPELVNSFMGLLEGLGESFNGIFTGIIDFLVGVFTGNWQKAWDGLANIVAGVVNSIIDIVQFMVNAVISAINALITGANKVGAALGLGWDINKISKINLSSYKIGYKPKPSNHQLANPLATPLATGAVLPPNNPFLAMVGDQKHGVNIEAPLDTIVDAFKQVTMGNGGMNHNATMNLDGQTFARLVVPYLVDELNRRGYNVDVLEA